MKLWKAILLTNLALAVGVSVGYVRWGREAGRLRDEVASLRARPPTTAGEWTAKGVVRAVLPDLNVLVLTHEEIGGLMPAMTMGFRVASPNVYDGLAVGDEIRFRVKGVPPDVIVIAVDKLQ